MLRFKWIILTTIVDLSKSPLKTLIIDSKLIYSKSVLNKKGHKSIKNAFYLIVFYLIVASNKLSLFKISNHVRSAIIIFSPQFDSKKKSISLKMDVRLRRRTHFTRDTAFNVENDNKSVVQVDCPSFFIIVFPLIFCTIFFFNSITFCAESGPRANGIFYFFSFCRRRTCSKEFPLLDFCANGESRRCTCIVSGRDDRSARAALHGVCDRTSRHAYVFIIIALHRVYTVTCT